MLNRFLWWFVSLFPKRSQTIENNGSPYLFRFYIKHGGILPGIYLHYFYRGDLDRDPHNHPWNFSFGFILTGGYIEERVVDYWELLAGGRIPLFKNKTFTPGMFNFINQRTFHRVDLIDKTWTVFITGREVQDWGFMDRNNYDKYIPHMEYLGLKEKFKDSVK